MAELIKALEIEILPSSQVPKLREDLATMEKFFNDLTPIYNEARAMQSAGGIKDKDKRIRAGELNAEFKRICGDAEETIKPHKKAVNDFKEKYILTPERKVNNRGEEIRGLLSSMMAQWDRDEQAAKDAEQARLRREEKMRLDRIAEEKRQADEAQAKELREKRVAEIRADLANGKFGDKKSAKAKRTAQKLLEQAGAMEEALKTQAAADEQEAKEKATQTAQTVKVQSNIPTVPGNVKRINYSAKCTDSRLFVLAMIALYEKKDMAGCDRLMEMVEVSNSLLSAEAKKRIKTHSDDDRHDLTAAEFLALYPFVELEEGRTY